MEEEMPTVKATANRWIDRFVLLPIKNIYPDIVGLIFATPIIGGFLLMLYQSITYLDTGVWIPFSLLDSFAFLGSEWAANASPERLIGLHKIFADLPLSGSLIIGGLLAAALTTWVVVLDQIHAEQKSEKKMVLMMREKG
jgi:hypothetical protein